MKTNLRSLTTLAFGLCLFASTLPGRADETFDRLVTRWKSDREALMRRTTQAWLKGDQTENYKGTILALSQLESGLATKPGIPLYLAAVGNPADLNSAIGSIVRSYLQARRIQPVSADFFRGQTFSVLREEEAPVPAKPSTKKPAEGKPGARK